MKKGISLIVLVITIIVMIILAAAIIISISNSNVINKANQAVAETNIASIKEAAALEYADITIEVKEKGESVLGGKTVGKYIEDKLLQNGILKETDPIIFTKSGGVYSAYEYNAVEDKDDAKDYREIDGKVYYVGTNINKRIALKGDSNINTDYILLDVKQSQYQNDEYWSYKLSDLGGYQGTIKSFDTVLIDGNGKNVGVNTASLPSNQDIILTTGTNLYLDNNYKNKLGMIVICGDSFCEGSISTSAAGFMLDLSERGIDTLLSEGNWDGWFKPEYIQNIKPMHMLLGDFDLDGILTVKEQYMSYNIAISMDNAQYQSPNGIRMKDMDLYTSAPSGDISQIGSKAWLDANFNTDKIIYGLPAYIAK